MNSFEKIQDWINQIFTNTNEKDISLVLLGNKCDSEERTVDPRLGEEKAAQLNIKYFETSAFNGTGINEAFESLTRQIMKKKGIKNDGGNVHGKSLSDRNKQEKKDCC